MEFTPLDSKRASDAFSGHRRSGEQSSDISAVFEEGDIDAYSTTYETSFEKHWMHLHDQHPNESSRHFLLKLTLADFVNDLGYDIEYEIDDLDRTEWRAFGRDTCYEVR